MFNGVQYLTLDDGTVVLRTGRAGSHVVFKVVAPNDLVARQVTEDARVSVEEFYAEA